MHTHDLNDLITRFLCYNSNNYITNIRRYLNSTI